MRVLLPVVLLIMVLQSCEVNINDKKTSPLQNLDWILGSWEDTSSAMYINESWEKQNDSTFTGKGYGIENGDTIFQENLKLAARRGDIFYIATVNEHLAGKPTAFKLKADSSEAFVFENPAHDFPQRIIYRQTGENTMEASIEGEVNGKLQSDGFTMRRVK